jgi:hypothetical protein
VFARATARVRDEHVANRNACATRQRTEIVCELDVLEWLKAVEDRLEQQRRRKDEEQHEKARADHGDERPPRGKEANRAQEGDHRRPGEYATYGEALHLVEEPVAHPLRGKAPAALARKAAPEDDR